MAARQKVVILEQTDASTYRYILWADVPAARQSFYAKVGAVSAWKDATAGDNSAIAAGQVVERVDSFTVPNGTTIATVRTQLEAKQVAFQTEITSANPWVRYGTTFDGTTWTAGGVV